MDWMDCWHTSIDLNTKDDPLWIACWRINEYWLSWKDDLNLTIPPWNSSMGMRSIHEPLPLPWRISWTTNGHPIETIERTFVPDFVEERFFFNKNEFFQYYAMSVDKSPFMWFAKWLVAAAALVVVVMFSQSIRANVQLMIRWILRDCLVVRSPQRAVPSRSARQSGSHEAANYKPHAIRPKGAKTFPVIPRTVNVIMYSYKESTLYSDRNGFRGHHWRMRWISIKMFSKT